MSRLRFSLLALLLTVAMVGIGWGIGQWRKPSLDTPPVSTSDRGALLFRIHCASCHGNDGHADGPSAADLRPLPRDFAARPWRFKPTQASIKRVTEGGIPGTSMPSFRSTLSGADVDLLVAHVHKLATQGPIIEHVPTPEEKLLRDADFIDLRGTDPPSLTVKNSKGDSVKLTDLRGKLVLLHFWGTGCVHCIKEMPALNVLEKRYAGRMALLNVCTDEDDSTEAQNLLDRLAPGTACHTEPSGLGLARFEVQALPAIWLIGPDGKAIARATGSKDWHSPLLTTLVEYWLPKSQ